MSLCKRFFVLGSILLMAALVFTFSPATPSAHAASVSASTHALSMTPSAPSPDFTCPSATICLFPNDNFTGTPKTCAVDVCRGAWFSTTVDGVHAGSITDNSNSAIVLGDVQDNFELCISAPNRGKPNHSFGFFRALFGVTSCPPPSQLPPLPS